MLACVLVLMLSWIVRHLTHGTVTSTAAVYYPLLISLSIAVVLLTGALYDMRQRIKVGRPMPGWRLLAGALLDLGTAFSILIILHVNSPRGSYAALSAPALLIIPMVIMLSVLRLRPWYTLALGVCAAIGHWLLVADTFKHHEAETHQLPLLASYGVLILLCGGMGASLSLIVRRYIQEAVSEAEAAERASRSLAELEHELDIARDIQISLLPSEPPVLTGFDFAGMARPATQAGGDYYDWQPLADGRLIAAIADVTGHGIGPALVMAVCRAYSRATIPTARNTTEYLERINALVSKDMSSGRFITMAVAIISENGDLELLSAGHGPNFIYRAASKTVDRFGGNGLPLGVMDDEKYTPTLHTRLEPGDALVLLTDGFMERANQTNELFGIDRLSETIIRHHAGTARQMVEALDAAATRFAQGTAQSDDMTAVVVRRNPVG